VTKLKGSNTLTISPVLSEEEAPPSSNNIRVRYGASSSDRSGLFLNRCKRIAK